MFLFLILHLLAVIVTNSTRVVPVQTLEDTFCSRCC